MYKSVGDGIRNIFFDLSYIQIIKILLPYTATGHTLVNFLFS